MIRIAYAEDEAETAAALKGYIERYASENALAIEAEHYSNA